MSETFLQIRWWLPSLMPVLFLVRLFMQKRISIPSAIELSVYIVASSIIMALTQDIKGLIGFDLLKQASEEVRDLAVLAPLLLVGVIVSTGAVFVLVLKVLSPRIKDRVRTAMVFLQPFTVFFVVNQVFAKFKIHQAVSVVFLLGGLGYLSMTLLVGHYNQRVRVSEQTDYRFLHFSFLTESFIPHVLIALAGLAIGNAFMGACAIPIVSLGFVMSGFVSSFYRKDCSSAIHLFKVLSFFFSGLSIYFSYVGISLIHVSDPKIYALTDVEALLGVVAGALLTVLCAAAAFEVKPNTIVQKMKISVYLIQKALLALAAVFSSFFVGFFLSTTGLAGMGIGLLILSLQYQLFFVSVESQKLKVISEAKVKESEVFLPLVINFTLLVLLVSILYMREIYVSS